MKIWGILSLLVLSLSINGAEPIKLLLTFDDGPATTNSSKIYSWSPTLKIIETLKQEKIAASFFVLTGKDQWLGTKFKKAESEEGFKILVETIEKGHHISCHWGGNYISQTKLHPPRLLKPAYDVDGDGIIDKVTKQGNALESDLLHCKRVVKNALAIGHSDQEVKHIRPPLWKFKKKNLDARVTYKKLGFKMVMSDTKLYDGGYWTAGLQRIHKMQRDLKKIVKSGKKNIIITMHDSNHRTAKHLGLYIKKIEKTFLKMGLERGKDWDFTGSRKEVEAFLNAYH